MVKQTRLQRLREKMQADLKYSKQRTLGNLLEASNPKSSKKVMEESKKHK